MYMNFDGTGKTIDLQGVASFASLVDLLSQELGVPAGKMLGQLPNGPDTFNQLLAEIDINSQGFLRKLTLTCQPGGFLSLRLATQWGSERNSSHTSGVTSDYHLTATVEQILPQARALARHIEDIFGVQDRMVTLGHSDKLATASVSASQIEAFERQEGSSVVTAHVPRGRE